MNEFLEEFHGNPPASGEDVRRSLDEVHAGFPAEYVGFLQHSNGGEGIIGENYLILWKAEEIGPLNHAYEIAEYAPELILIGSNGGGEAIAFDTRNNPWENRGQCARSCRGRVAPEDEPSRESGMVRRV